MGPMGHVPGPPAEGTPRAEHIFLRQRELVVGCTALHGTYVYRDLERHCQEVGERRCVCRVFFISTDHV